MLASLPGLLVLLFLAGGCSQESQTAQKLAQDSKKVQEFQNTLTFNAVTLEETNEAGQTLWKVKAKQANYSRDKRSAEIQEPEGELYQDGKPILRVSAKTGEFRQKEKKIFLRGDIKAIDKRDGLTLYGNELEWQPQNKLLIVRNSLVGEHKQVKLYGKEGRYYTKDRRIEVQGQVTAISAEQDLHFRTEKMTWMVDQQTLTSNTPVQVERHKDKTIVARATGKQGIGNLKTKTVTLKQDSQVNFTKPALQITSNELVWTPDNQLVESPQPITVVNAAEQITVSGNQGRLNLATNIANMTGNVLGIIERKQARLNANTLTWNLTTNQFEAEGDVVYRQEGQPPLNLTGPRAKGELQGQTVVVSGGRVETQFVP